MQTSSGYRSFFCRNTLKSLFSLSPLRPLSVAALFLFTALVFLAFPIRAAAYTYQDVMDFVAEEQAPLCSRWIEPIEDWRGKGYNVFRRCYSTQYTSMDIVISGATTEWTVEEGRTGYAYDCSGSGGSQRTEGPAEFECRYMKSVQTFHYCNGYTYTAVREGLILACGLSDSCLTHYSENDVDCTPKDRLWRTFMPVDECYNKLTGQYEECAQNCGNPDERDPAEEVCSDGIDNNCNGEIDEGCSECVDNDNDGYDAYGPDCMEGTDCDDSNSLVYAGTVGCEDCVDDDGDGYFGYDVFYCSLGTDCDDSNPEIYPGQGCPECVDADGDGYFAYDALACPEGTDCDDGNDSTNPGAEEACGDGVDNNCDAGGSAPGTVDEGCSKILQYESGSAQSALTCETLLEPLMAKVENEQGNPEGGVAVRWSVVASPAGSGGAGVSPSSTETSLGTGLTFTEMTLGNRRGAYMVDATCADCDDGSPQTFTFEALCPAVTSYKQNDYPDEPYANICKNGKKAVPCSEQYSEPWTIKEKGCALTSISMILHRFGFATPPLALNYHLSQNNMGYNGHGSVYWESVNYMTSQQIKYKYDSKHYGRLPSKKSNGKRVSKRILDSYLEKCIPIVAQVYNPDTKREHWVVVTEKDGNDYAINDPGYSGKSYLSSYGDIYGIRVFENQNGGCQ